ncbi:MAG: aminopeptidase [Nanoarchaeota archaeon]|nr:aminopeptidase [Nanoarchaeota archaeon]
MAENTGSTRTASSSSKLERALKSIYRVNLAVKPHEKVAIVFDERKKALAKKFHTAAETFSAHVTLIEIPEMNVNGQEPPAEVARILLPHDVALFVTEKSLSHTKARRDCTDKGMRIASMPGITEDMLKRCIETDYARLRKDTARVADLLDAAKSARIRTKAGTDLSLSIAGRKAHGRKAGIFDQPGYWGNLPEGEAFIAPVEGTANGTLVIDGSIANTGRVKRVVMTIKNGEAVSVIQGTKRHALDAVMEKTGRKARNIAELGIGLNRNAKITGLVLEDEKVYGTCHIAVGNNIGFGGTVDVPLHIDSVVRNPSIFLDGKCVMKSGKLL